MNAIIMLPVVLPLIGAALCILVGKSRPAQRVISLSTLTAVAAIAMWMVVDVDRNGTKVTQAGGWRAPVGITMVADRFSAMMLAVSAIVLLLVLVYAVGQRDAEGTHVGFHPVYLVLSAGVASSFLTGDLFNLFVSFEIMLTSSYVLITLGGTKAQVRSGMTYVVISLLASTLFLSALAITYMATGTVNMADLSGRIAELPEGMRSALGLLLIVVFGVKAALFPLYFWLPDSYPTAPSPITAVFAGLLTKVGVYAIIRSQTLLIPAADRAGTVLLIVAALTMLVGVFGAISQNDVKRVLSFHIISQIGYMIMGLGLFTIAGLAGALLYIIHHIIVKTTLFLTAGLIEHTGRTGRLAHIGGIARRLPVLAALFLLPALSLAGIPPFSGFVAKLALVSAGLDAGEYVVVGISLLVSLFTLFSMTKIWAGAFWGESHGDNGQELVVEGRLGTPRVMTLATGTLAALSIVIALASGPLYRFSERAAADLLDPARYVMEVLGR